MSRGMTVSIRIGGGVAVFLKNVARGFGGINIMATKVVQKTLAALAMGAMFTASGVVTATTLT